MSLFLRDEQIQALRERGDMAEGVRAAIDAALDGREAAAAPPCPVCQATEAAVAEAVKNERQRCAYIVRRRGHRVSEQEILSGRSFS